jgi:HKD family nuclease
MELITNFEDNNLIRWLSFDTRSERPLAKVDIICSYIKQIGVTLLRDVFEGLKDRNIEVRVLTTTAMGISEPVAIRHLAVSYPNMKLQVL